MNSSIVHRTKYGYTPLFTYDTPKNQPRIKKHTNIFPLVFIIRLALTTQKLPHFSPLISLFMRTKTSPVRVAQVRLSFRDEHGISRRLMSRICHRSIVAALFVVVSRSHCQSLIILSPATRRVFFCNKTFFASRLISKCYMIFTMLTYMEI